MAQLKPRMEACVRAVATKRKRNTPVRIVERPNVNCKNWLVVTHDASAADSPFYDEACYDGTRDTTDLM